MQKKSSTSVRVFYPRFDKDEIIERLKVRLPLLAKKLPLLRAVLFGSYAKGNYTVASDIDLLIVYKGKQRKDAFAICKKTLGIPGLEPHLYSKAESEEAKERLERMTRNGVVLFPQKSEQKGAVKGK